MTIENLKKSSHQILPETDFIKKIESGKKLILKLGADPTSPNLHLGHAVVLLKMRQFQDAGHHVIFIIGDFTARIGDPTGRSKTRPALSEEEISENTRTYLEQVTRILDFEKLTVMYNSEWLNKINSKKWIELCSKITVARLIEREDFANRLTNNQPIGLHELMYPILQGYDSVEIKADIEFGGTDQTFNMLMGRQLQEAYDLEPQVIVTMPLLIGTDGKQKMSKSYKNDIGLTENPITVFGKIMSLSDESMWEYYKILLQKDSVDITEMKKAIEEKTLHPMLCKKNLAIAILETLWSKEDAQKGLKSFEDTCQKNSFDSAEILVCSKISFPSIIDLLVYADQSLSRSQARRLIMQKSIEINGNKIEDTHYDYKPVKNDCIKIGKHKRYIIK